MLSELWHKRLITLIISTALFMEALDSTILNTAIPAMSRSLHVNPIDLKIALISYLLSLAIFIPISGWVADKFGSKRVFMCALLVFTASSFWCGFTNNLSELIVGRMLQGVGGALAAPVGRLIILRTFERHQVISAMNAVVMVAALGALLGPLLGGIITQYSSWRWIFWINIPVGIIAYVLTMVGLKAMPPKPTPPLDKLGFLLFGVSLALFTFGLSSFSETIISNTLTLGIITSALLLFLGYIWHSRTQPHPIIKTQLLHLHTLRVSIIGNLLLRLSLGAVPFLLPLLLQIALHYSPTLSGLVLGPPALGILIAKPISLPMLRALGYKRLLILNTILVALFLGLFSFITAQTPIYYIGILTFFFGGLVSVQYTAMNSLGYADVPTEQLSAATSMISTMQQLTLSFGVAVAAILLRAFSSHHAALSLYAFHHTFVMLGIITLCALFIFIRLKPEDGLQMISKQSTNT